MHQHDLVPTPPDLDDQRRARSQGQRRALLESCWDDLAVAHAKDTLGPLRAAAAAPIDTSTNVLRQVVYQLARLYAQPPTVGHEDEGSAAGDAMSDVLEAAGVWGLSQRAQRLTLAANESVIVLGWAYRQDEIGNDIPGTGRLTAEVVPADLCWGEPDPYDPTQPVVLYRARQRRMLVGGKIEKRWTWDVWDIRPMTPEERETADPSEVRPSFRVLDAERRKDLTAQYVTPEEWRGSAYPYRDEMGHPVIPAVVYHRQPGTLLFDGHDGHEIVLGTLRAALIWTAAEHAFFRASWAQRYVIGGRVQGGAPTTKGGTTVREVEADPTSVLFVESTGDGTPSAGQWTAAVDVDKAERFARSFATRLAVNFDLSPGDLSVDANTYQSGVAMIVSREAQRAARKAQIPLQQRGDLLLMARAAAILRAKAPAGSPLATLPDTGYRISYAGVELDPLERQQRGTNARNELQAGLLTRVDAVRELHPNWTREQAEEYVQQIRDEIQQEAAPAESAPPPA